jgi:hypothetical protein
MGIMLSPTVYLDFHILSSETAFILYHIYGRNTLKIYLSSYNLSRTLAKNICGTPSWSWQGNKKTNYLPNKAECKALSFIMGIIHLQEWLM